MQTVEIQASAASLQTDDAKSSVTISNRLVNDLPLVVGGSVRSPFDLAVLTPESKNLGGDAGFSLGGGQAASYGTTLDGISANTSRGKRDRYMRIPPFKLNRAPERPSSASESQVRRRAKIT